MHTKMEYLRGTIHFADLGYGEKPFLIVSNNNRNRALGSALAARITTSRKPELASIIPLSLGEPIVGSVLCDDLETLYPEDSRKEGGALSPSAMRAVNRGLKIALGL